MRKIVVLFGILELLIMFAVANATATLIHVASGDSPAWSLDGQHLAFDRNNNIYTIKINSSDEHLIASLPGSRKAWDPTYRPNSNQIYYMDNSPSGADFHWINWTSTDGSAGRNQVIMVPGGDGFSAPKFSPDGNQFVYRHWIRHGTDKIMIADYDGTNVHSIKSNDTIGGVTWGKGINGNKLAYTKIVDGIRSIFTINIDGTGETRITDGSFGNVNGWINWSIDGKSLLFSYLGDIWTIDIDTSNFRQLTNDPYQNNYAVFSSDGSMIAYSSIRNGQSEIYLLDVLPVSIDRFVNTSGSDDIGDGTKENPWLTIQHAIDSVQNGSTIHVAAGTYTENIQMKSGVNIIGNSSTNTLILGSASVSGVVTFHDVINTTLQGFKITVSEPVSGYDRAVVFSGNTNETAVLQNCFLCNTQYGIFVCDPATPTIQNNTLVGEPDEQGIYIGNSATAPIIRNNIITGYFLAGIHVVAGTSLPVPIITHNNLWDNGTNYLDYPTQTGINGNISVDPLFVDAPNDDFHLTSRSPCIDAGDSNSPSDPDGSRIDMGAFYFSEKLNLSINTHWYNWATTFPEYQNKIAQFNFVRDGAWWSALEATDYITSNDWGNAAWNYSYDITITNCNQSTTYQSGYDELVKKFQSSDAPELLLLLDIHNDKLNLDANVITYDQYYDYVYHVVERYDGDGYNDMQDLTRPVIYFEIGNEIDSSNPQHSHNLTLENYVNNRLIPAYRAAKAANPSAVILNAGLAMGGDTGFDTTYLQNMLDLLQVNNGEQNNYYMDKLAIHYYYDPQDPEYFDQNIQQVKSMMESYNLGSKPVWITEFGIATKNDAGGQIREEDQASVLLRYRVLMNVHNIQNSFIYNLKDVNSIDPSDWENVWGIYKVNCQAASEIINEKLSVKILNTFYDKTAGLNFESINPEAERNQGIYKVIFSNTDKKVQIIWYTAFDNTGINPNHASETTTIQLSLGANIGTLSDMYGNILEPNLVDGTFITIGEKPQYVQIDSDDSLVAYWSFDDGDALDASGNGHDGIICGNPHFVNGIKGQAIKFEGRDDYVEIANTSNFQLKTWSITGWIKVAEFPTGSAGVGFLGKYSDSNHKYNFALTLVGDRQALTSQYETCSSEYDHFVYSDTIQSNKWICFASVRDEISGKHTLYIDGIEIDFGTWPDLPCTNNENLYIGILNVVIDDVRIYNRTLAKEEVQQLFRQGSEDSDSDGIIDTWETANGLNPNDPSDAQQDPDNDDLTNLEEYEAFTNPNNPDSDNDGMPDGWEVLYALDPTTDDSFSDTDNDGLTNSEEYQYRTDPTNDDTDGDGISDGNEVTNGTNPRAMTSSLTSDTSDLTLSVGANQRVVLRIANNNTVSDTFDLSVTGIAADWYIMDQTQVILSAGEVRDVQLDISVPEECSLIPLEYTIQVSAVSPDTGPVVNGGANIQLHVLTAPIVTAISLQNGESLATNSVQITWQTDVSATTEVHYRIAGTEEYTVVTGEAGKMHRIVLEELNWDKIYDWYAVFSGPCEASQTQPRTFFVRDGIVFENKESSHDILRDYDQQISFTIINQDIASHKVLVEVMNPRDDLIAGFVGSGSHDGEITLDAGETETMTLAVHAQDTKLDQYVLTLKLTADADGDNPIVDYARAIVNVADPVFDLNFVEISSSPAILTNTYRITNNGDTITDLRVFAEEAIVPQILFQPKIDHVRLQNGESIVFAATFQATDSVSQYSGLLTAEAAEQSMSIATHFGCPDGTSLYEAVLTNVHICLKAGAWYCTNKPVINVNFDVPQGVSPENIDRARLYMNFNLPWPSNTYRNHSVTVKLNDHVVETYGNTVPEGAYGIEIEPSLINTGTGSIGRNTVTLETSHMNKGHYVVVTDFQLILDVASINMGSVCAASQEEANLSAQNFPFLCNGEPAWALCPRIDGVIPLDENGNVKWNFNPGETVQFRVTTVNSDLDDQVCNLNFIIDDDFNTAGTPFEQNRSFTMVPGGLHAEIFWWEIPDAEAKFYHTMATLAGSGDCSNEKNTTNTIAINQPVVGQVQDNETGLGLEGVEVCAYGIDPISLYVACATTDESGMFTLYLPDGSHAVFATKDGYSLDSVVVDTAGISPILSLSHDSSHLGDEADSGYANDPVNTALGNFTLDHADLFFKGRGLNFSFERFYNSQDTYHGPLGYGWTHNYNINVNKDGSVAVIKFGDGRNEFYVRQADQSYKAQPGVHNTLAELPDGSFVLKDKSQTVHNFDATGSLISIVDKNGNTISLIYQDGSLTTVTDPVGRQVQFTYDAENRITQIEYPLSRTIRFAYDAGGDLVSSFDAMGSENRYTYDDRHQMLTATDPEGNVFVTNTYDTENRVVTAQSDALGNISLFDYDEKNHQTTITDPLGNKTVHLHDNRNRLIKVIDPLRNAVAVEYDNDNNRTRVVDKRGNETRFEYDAPGNITRIIDALAHETSIVYNDKNNPVEKTDALGHKTAFEYDDRGNLVKIIDTLLNQTTIVVNEFGQPTSVTDARNSVTQYTYDPQGNLIETRDALNYTVIIDHDEAGRIISVTNQRGHTTTFAYDANDNLTTTTDPLPFAYTAVNGYDLNGNRGSVKDKRGYITAFSYDQKNRIKSATDPLAHAVNYEYDALDRNILQTDKRGKNTALTYDANGNLTAVTDALGNTVSSFYDVNGNLMRRVDPMGRMVLHTYDELNRLILTEDALGNHTEYSYDALGSVSDRTDANGRITRYEYDGLGRLIKVIEPGNIETLFEYDKVGNKIGFTNGNGIIFTYKYDSLNRLTQDADGYQYEYDGAGNLTKRTDAKGQEIVYQYNELNRLTVVRYPDASEVSFAYDASGNQINMVDSLGTTVKQYNELNGLTQTTDSFGKVVGFGYDEGGNRTTLTYPDSSIVQYSYDDLNRLQTVTDWQSRVSAYNYDNAGKLIGITYPNGTIADTSYDNAGRLTALANKKANKDIICSYSFTYDPVGNRTQVAKTEPLIPFIKDASITYQYDSDNRITAITDGAVTFDANGSITSKTEGTRTVNFSWNFENRLQQVDDGIHTANYIYDGLNNRLASVRDGATTRYVLDTGTALPSVLAETDESGNITSRYIYGLGLIAKGDDQGVHYYHYDPQGSTISLSDETGEITDKYAYDPFGGLANRAGSTENPFTFVGQFGLMDEGDGLYYVRARYYDSENGRFLNKDLILGEDTDPISLHRYVYVMNRPVGFVDVSGLCGEDGSTDSWWYKATGWVDPIVESSQMGYESAKEFASLFTNKAGWKAAGEGWKEAGWETAKFAGRLAKEIPSLAQTMAISFALTGGNPSSKALYVQISESTRNVAGIDSPKELNEINNILKGTSRSMNLVRVPMKIFSDIDYFEGMSRYITLGKAASEVYSWWSWSVHE